MKYKGNDNDPSKKIINMTGAITGVVFFTLAAKLLGFLREIVLSGYFGATGISDAYLISQTIPGTIFQFVGVGLSTCFIPIYFKILYRTKTEVNAFTNKILTIILIFSTIVIVIIWMATPTIVKMFASGFVGDTLYYAVWFTRIGVLSLYFSTLIYVFNSYLQANNVFTVTAFSVIPNNICIILSIVLGARCNIWFMSIGSTLAVGLQLLFLIPAVKKLNFRFAMNFHWNSEYVKDFFSLMLPVICGVSVNEINTLVDRTVASQVVVGGISALTYSYSLIMLIQGGFVQPIVTVCYPQITDAIIGEKWEEAKVILKRVSGIILSFLIPTTAGLILYSKQIIKMLFGRGMFDQEAVLLTASALSFYAAGICFVGIRELLSKFYYANRDTKTPMYNSMIGVSMNIILNFILSRYFGIGGLAFATSISAIFTSFLLLKNLRKRVFKETFMIISVVELIKICIATVIMVVISYSVYKLLNSENMMCLLIAILLGVVSYGMAGYILKMDIVNTGLYIIKKKKQSY